MKIKKNAVLLLLFIFNLALVLAFYGLDLRYKIIKAYESDKLSFDSRSHVSGLSLLKEIRETQYSNLKEIHVTFQTKVYSIGEFNNIFQTANANQGIRLEISKPSTLALVIGAGKVVGIVLTNSLELDRWYAISISIDRSGEMEAFIDGKQVASIFLDSPDFRIDDIAIGTGFSKTRPFDGKIKAFSINYKLFEKQSSAILIPFYLVLLIGLFLFLILLQKRIREAFPKQVVKFSQLYLELRNRKLSRDLKLKYLITIITIGFVAITIFYYYRGMVLGMGYPKNTFLPAPVTRFGDFFGVVDQWSRMGFNGVGYGLSYFPSTYLIADMFSHIQPIMSSLITFLTIFFCFFLLYAYLNLRSRSNHIETIQNVVVCAFMTYPVLFTIHTANFEAFVFMFLCLFVYLYERGKFALSSLFLAMCISMKVFPAVFLILFVADKKYKEIFLTLIAVVILSLLPLLIFNSGMSNGFGVYLGNLKASQKMYADLMIMGTAGNNFGHSLLNGLRIVMGGAFPPMQKILLPYLALSLFFFSMLSLFIIFVEPVFWKRITLLVVSMCLLPYTSTDYKLLHFFIPLFLFINHGKTESEESEPFDLYYILLFSLLLIPKNYYYFYDNPYYTINNVLNPIFMIVLLFLIFRSRMQHKSGLRIDLRRRWHSARTGDVHCHKAAS